MGHNKRSHLFRARTVGLILMAGLIALSGCTAASQKQESSTSQNISSQESIGTDTTEQTTPEQPTSKQTTPEQTTSEKSETPTPEKPDESSVTEPSEAVPFPTNLSGWLPQREGMTLSVCGAADGNHILLLYASDDGRSFAVDRLNTNNGKIEVVTENTSLYRPRSTTTPHRFDFADADTVVDKTDGVIYFLQSGQHYQPDLETPFEAPEIIAQCFKMKDRLFCVSSGGIYEIKKHDDLYITQMITRTEPDYRFLSVERIDNGRSVIIGLAPERDSEPEVIYYSTNPFEYEYKYFTSEDAPGQTCCINEDYYVTLSKGDDGSILNLHKGDGTVCRLDLPDNDESINVSGTALSGSSLYFTVSGAGKTELYRWDLSSVQPQVTPTRSESEYSLPKISDEDIETMRTALQDEFGVVIKLREEMEMTHFYYLSEPLQDDQLIYSTMLSLRNLLRMYPDGFFKQMSSDKGEPIHIELVEGIRSTTGEGVGSPRAYASGQYGLLVICGGYNFTKSVISHEIYHLIYHKIELSGGIKEVTEDFYSTNPDDFEYANNYNNAVTDEYTALSNNPGEHFENVYFVSDYGKQNENEEMAEFMGNLLSGDIIPDYYESVHLQEKGSYIFGIIRKYYDTEGWPKKNTWERRLGYAAGQT